MDQENPRYAIGDLAELGGVSRRTVRYYVQENLLPAALGAGRGRHYGPEHLERLLRAKAMQEAGRSLDEIREAFGSTAGRLENAAGAALPRLLPLVERSLWRRLVLAPGVELHVASDLPLPSPSTLQQLADWCRAHLHLNEDDQA